LDKILKLLDNADYNPNIQDGEEYLLHVAVKGGDNSRKLYDSLTSHRLVDVNVRDKEGRTPFFVACKMFPGSRALFNLLEIENVDVNIPSEEGVYPLMIMAEKLSIQELQGVALNFRKTFLLQTEEEISFASILKIEKPIAANKLVQFEFIQNKAVFTRLLDGNSAEELRIFLDRTQTGIIKIINTLIIENAYTALMHACRKQRHDIMEVLLEIPSLDVNWKNPEKKTAFSFACEINSTQCFQLFLDNKKLASETLIRGMNEICVRGHVELLSQWIISDLTLPDALSNGKPFQQVAKDNNHPEIAEIFSNLSFGRANARANLAK
jgi:ankyrin repeat protein